MEGLDLRALRRHRRHRHQAQRRIPGNKENKGGLWAIAQVGGDAADGPFVRVDNDPRIAALERELEVERERTRRLEAQLRNLADHDPVTDLLNRPSIEHELDVHLALCARYGPAGALLLVGLDGLDEIARTQSRQESDEMLATLADEVAKRLRATDVVGRWDDDQLAVLLPRAAGAEAAVVADALVSLVGGTSTPRVPPGALVASVGVAPVLAAPTGATQLAADAAEAMGTVRRQGGGGWGAAFA